MARTDNFRKQHADIIAIARQINAHFDRRYDEGDAIAIKRLLSKLHGLVGLHLAMEDKSLYPNLLNHADPRLGDMARKYMSEMGELAQAFEAYVRRWAIIANIVKDQQAFATESKAVFNALSKRIHHENTNLYTLVDSLDMGTPAL